ncbi:MAG TPA: hypothetical protein DEO49_08770, partial [Sutterella sp.]|nr:hypothetical protein [Sutterella sp.]
RRYHRAQSPLAIVLRDLQMRAGNKALPPASKALRPYDSEDADLLDRCALRLRRDQLDVLRIAYLDRHTALDYETAEDAWRSEKKKARIAHCSVRFWRQLVREAETELMRRVQSQEEKVADKEGDVCGLR